MKRLLLSTFLIVITASLTIAQEGTPPPFFLLTAKDKVYILLGKVPRGSEGFYLYRKAKGEKEFVRLTEEPIKPVRDPITFRSMIEEDYEWVKKATKGEDEFQVLRRILRDEGTQVAFSFSSLRLAKALGRLYVDENVTFGMEYTYKVVFIDYKNAQVQVKEKSCVVKEAQVPKPPFEVKAQAGDSEIKVEWKYYKLPKEFEYTAVGFNIYRRAEGENEFKKINPVLILWQEDMTYRVDYEVVNGKRYTYYVTAVDLIGMESEASNYAEGVPVDKTPPLMPEGVAAKGIENIIVIGWRMNLELDLSHYNIYRGMSLEDEFKKINKEPIPADIPYYEDRDIKAGKLYFYKVEAVDKAGNASRLTSAVSALVEDRIPPRPPTAFKAVVKERKVTLSWQQQPEEEDLLGFYIYRGESKEDFMRIVKTPLKEKVFKDEGYQNKGLLPGGGYFYGVSSVDNAYNESERIWVEVVIPDDEPPATPVSIYARPTEDGKVEVLWQAAHSWDVTGYRVYRGDDKEKPKPLVEVGKSILSWLDDKVEKGKRYFYYVVAIDKAKNESKPTNKFYVTATDITLPPTPTNIEVVFSEEGVILSWDEVKIDDLAGYRVFRAEILSGVYELLNPDVLIKETRFVDKEGKKDYYYKVASVDTSGNESKRSDAIRPKDEDEE